MKRNASHVSLHSPPFPQQEANTPENRALRPWLVVYGHRPMYCSAFTDDNDCLNTADLLRVGIPEEGM